ncbi:MAG: proteasome subunit alpha, partial [Methanotrichaceae archaeon]|nr:proteasome subunit alpha [Methanotrichaceae archaeon]
YKATGIGAGRSAVMEVFEEKYTENLTMDAAILLGLEALYKAAEGKVEAATTEIGMIKLTDKKFYKLNEKEVADFVEKMKSQLGGGKGEA